MHILLFGRTGQVAVEIRRRATEGLTITSLGRQEADLTDPAACARAVRAHAADAVVNATAFTAVDKAEGAERTAMLVNAEGPGAMAAVCADRGIPFVHLSTDYVFGGGGARPLREDDPVGPINAYGRSKLAGEKAVAAAGGRWATLRTSWVFSAHGQNFVRTMLRLASVRDRLSVVDDQHGCPTAASDIAGAVITLAGRLVAGQGEGGLFHYCGAPATTWFGFAREIFEALPPAARPVLTPIATRDWPTPATRPGNTVLDCRRIHACHGIEQPDWCAALAAIRADLPEAA